MPALEVKILKVEQGGAWTTMTIQVTNHSDAFLSFWAVSAALYDSGKGFLANQDTNGSNLRQAHPPSKEFCSTTSMQARSNPGS